MNIKDKLQGDVWNSEKYYDLAKEASSNVDHPGMRQLIKLSKQSKKILDLGCGEGTRLNILTKDTGSIGVGVDISKKSIALARKFYPNLSFVIADLENIPLEDNNFDLIYLAAVLEHITYPEKVLKEAIRLLSKSGYLVLISPNYGAPNRSSPVFKGSRVKKLFKGFFDDFLIFFKDKKRMHWNRVTPVTKKESYHMDLDTTIEPYLGSLIQFFRSLSLIIINYDSCWSEELAGAKIHQKLFRFLGEWGIYPFRLWGPHLLLILRKSYE